ncbi:translation initiation factor eIF 4e-like domain-containing protein [Dipodascopsis uninucleata]
MADTESTSNVPVEVMNEKAAPAVEISADTSGNAVDGSQIEKTLDVDTVRSVFDSNTDFTVKHPLKHTWTLWYTKPQTGGGKTDWSELLKEVVSFDSVEEFWGVYNNIPKASEIPLKSDYHLFKKGIRPEWEDKQNQNGGKWAYQCQDKRTVNIDELWLHTLLSAVGETLEDESDNEIMGVVVTIRKAHYRISVWTRTHNNEKILKSIGRRFKESLNLPPSEVVTFASHADAASSGSARAKSKYSI